MDPCLFQARRIANEKILAWFTEYNMSVCLSEYYSEQYRLLFCFIVAKRHNHHIEIKPVIVLAVQAFIFHLLLHCDKLRAIIHKLGCNASFI